MTDVFLSCAREDEDAASELVQFLERQGFSVWWDKQIAAGDNWEREIEEAIRQTRCVVVLWTPNSVESHEVRSEARFAIDQAKILPVLLEDVEVPLSYRTIHYCDLRGWSGGEHPSLNDLCRTVEARVSGTADGASVGREERKRTPAKGNRVPAKSVAWLILPTLLVALAVVVLMNWHTPTEIKVDVLTRLVRLKGAGGQPSALLEASRARSLSLSGFDHVTVSPTEVWVADPARYDIETDSYPEAAWSRLDTPSKLVLRPAEPTADATATIESNGASAASLNLGPLYVGDANIVISIPEKGVLAVRLRRSRENMEFSLPEEFQMDTTYCALPGILPDEAPSVRLRVRLPQNSRILELSPGANGVRLDIQSADAEGSYLAGHAFPIAEAEFIDQGPTGEPASTITGSGAITYERYQDVPPVPLTEGEYLYLGDLDRFYLNGIAPAGNLDSLRIGLHGVAGRISSGPSGYVRDRRLTAFDKLWANPRLAALFAMVAWLVPSLVALRKLYREMRGGRA